MRPEAKRRFDAVIVGGGPCGSTVAALLAAAGRRVVLVDKARFPRYHIGESLLPHCWYTLDRLGVVEKIRRAPFAVDKNSVQFVSTTGRRAQPYYFFQHRDHPSSRTWQVERSQFDAMLLENARDKGALVMTGTAASDLLREGGRVTGILARRGDETLELRGSVTVDASGRDAFAQSKNDWKIPDPVLRKLAIWSYFRGSRRDAGLDAGATTVAYLPDKGWIWHIPLPDDLVSVGVVASSSYLYRDGKDPERIFLSECRRQPWIWERVSGARLAAPCRVTGDYSYRSRYAAEDGLVLAGDAFSFIDPVFSSGVMLALWSGEMAADAIHAALDRGDVDACAFREYADRYRAGIESMRRLVYAFYDPEFHFSRFLRDHPDLREDLTDCLIGDTRRDYDDLFDAIGRYSRVPKPLRHGAPKPPSRAAPA